MATAKGEMGRFISFWCQISSAFHTPKIIKIGYFLTELFKKIKWRTDFLGHTVHCTS